MRALTEEQQAAVDYRFDAPLAIVAGAGSGKTETLTRRVARAISSGARPEGVLVLTFSNKAARELRGRLAKHLGEAVAARVECATFHSFCLRLLRRFGREAGLGPDFSIFGDSAQRALVKLCCAAAGNDDDAVERDARQVWSLIKRAKSSRLRAGDFDGRVGAIFRAYSAKLREQRAVDFDDVIDVAAGLLARDGPCRSWARGRFALGSPLSSERRPGVVGAGIQSASPHHPSMPRLSGRRQNAPHRRAEPPGPRWFGAPTSAGRGVRGAWPG